MKRAGHIGLAIGIGYVLGRRRKLRAALLLGVAAATGRLGAGPAARLRGGDKGEEAPPDAGKLARLSSAGKSAASSAASRPIEMLTERLNASAQALRERAKPQSGGQQSGESG